MLCVAHPLQYFNHFCASSSWPLSTVRWAWKRQNMKKWARSSRGKSLEAWTGQAFIYDRRDIPNWVQLEDRWNLGASKSTDTQRGTGGPRDFGRSDFLELDWWLILDIRFMVSYLFMPATDAGTINYHVYIYIYIYVHAVHPHLLASRCDEHFLLWCLQWFDPQTKPRAESVVAPSELSEVARAGDLSGHIEGGRALRREVNITKHLCHLAHNHIFLEFRTCIISFKKQMLIHSWLPDFDYLWLRAKRNL